MRVANQPTKGQLRVVKKKITIKDEVRHIQDMRKQLLHQLPQIFAAADPQPANHPEYAAKVESIGLVKEEHDVLPEDVDDFAERLRTASRLARTINTINMAIRWLTITTCLLCLGNVLAEFILLPLDRNYLGGSAEAAELYALDVARLYMESGLAVSTLVYHERDRALGLLILCAVVAEIVMLCGASDSGFEIGFLVSIPMAGIKAGLGWLGLVDACQGVGT